MESSIQHNQTPILFNAFTVSRTTLTSNTTFTVNCNNRTKRSRLNIICAMKFHACVRRTIFKSVVLQRTLSALITNRTIEWMIQKCKLQHALLCFFNLFAYRFHNHIGRNIHRAGSHQLGHFFDFNQAHTTTAKWPNFFVITKNRDIDIDLFSSIDYFCTLGNSHRLPVNR